MRFELMTSSLPRRRSTPELRGRLKDEVGRTKAEDYSFGSSSSFGICYPPPNSLERATRFELATLSLEG